jgi:hypothetical protein
MIIEGIKEETAMKKSKEEIEIRIEMIREGVEAEIANARNVEEVKVLKIGKEIEVIETEAIEGVVMTVIDDLEVLETHLILKNKRVVTDSTKPEVRVEIKTLRNHVKDMRRVEVIVGTEREVIAIMITEGSIKWRSKMI